jgi:hypothetical protein
VLLVGPKKEMSGSHLVAIRTSQKDNRNKASLIYFTKSLQVESTTEVLIVENTELVDGIGGTTWEGSFLLSHVLDTLSDGIDSSTHLNNIHILELGCGSGLVGLSAALKGFSVTLTDRETDLAKINYTLLQQNYPETTLDVHIQNLEWGDETMLNSLIEQRGNVDILVGAEILCLRKQHPYLLRTIQYLAELNPAMIILFTADGANEKIVNSIAEEEFILKMKTAKSSFRSARIAYGEIRWEDIENQDHSSDNNTYDYSKSSDILSTNNQRTSKVEKASITDITSHCPHDLHWLSFPPQLSASFSSFSSFSTITTWHDQRLRNAQQIEDNDYHSHHEIFRHHILCFYQPSIVMQTCQRCQKQYFSGPSQSVNLLTNPSKISCRFHSQYFVCRRHPAEVRCSINGLGDQLGYYGTGEEDYEAKFWDCCGSEDINCLGCCRGQHIPY